MNQYPYIKHREKKHVFMLGTLLHCSFNIMFFDNMLLISDSRLLMCYVPLQQHFPMVYDVVREMLPPPTSLHTAYLF